MHRIEGANVDTSSGVNLFKTTPPYTVISPELMNAIQEEIAYVITQSGLALCPQNGDTRTQLYEALRKTIQPYDYVVASQQNFSDLIERTAANVYQFKSQYKSVYFRSSVSYYSVPSILTGGDTWGDISTNNCKSVEFENGAVINFGDARGNLTVNTVGCYLKNVDIQGIGVAAAGVVNSYLLANNYVTFDNCKTSLRNSNVDFVGFQGSGTTLHNTTSKYRDCSVYTIDGSDKIYGYNTCNNLSNCLAYDLDGTTDNVVGFYNCLVVLGCSANTITATSNDSYGFDSCLQISGCRAQSIVSTNSNSYGFYACSQVSGCLAVTITGGSGAGDTGYGFGNCAMISACQASTIDGNVNEGFHNCSYGAALYTNEAANFGNTYMCSLDAQIVAHESTPQVWT